MFNIGERVKVSVLGEVWLGGFIVVAVHDPLVTRYNIEAKNINTGVVSSFAHWEVQRDATGI